MNSGWYFRLCLVAVPLLIACGCSSGPPGLVPAAGKVEFGGKPVADASLAFIPDTAKNPQGRSASAQTDAQGAFKLQTAPRGEGALPGTYRVTVNLYPGQKIPFSPDYTRLDKTTLIVEIPQGGKSDLVLKLD